MEFLGSNQVDDIVILDTPSSTSVDLHDLRFLMKTEGLQKGLCVLEFKEGGTVQKLFPFKL